MAGWLRPADRVDWSTDLEVLSKQPPKGAMSDYNKTALNVVVLVLLTLFVVAPLARPGFLSSAAGFAPAWSLNALLDCGVWPAGIDGHSDSWGEGPLPLLAAAVFSFLGAGAIGAVKWSFALAYFAGGLGMYLWLHRTWGEPAAVLAGVVYTFLPFRIAVTYVAGSLADSWALGLLPLTGWAMWRFSQEPRWTRGGLAFLAWLALALSQAGLAVLFAFVAGCVMLILHRRPVLVAPLIGALPLLVWGILQGTAGDFHDHYPYLFQLFSAGWEWVPSGSGWRQEMPFQLGLIPLGLAALALIAGPGKGETPSRKGLILCAAGVAVACVLTISMSSPLWKLTRLDRILLYPWQMLGFAGLGLALMAGALVRREPRLGTLPWLSGLIALSLVAVYGYLAPAWTDHEPRRLPIALFGANQIALADYTLDGRLAAGETVSLEITWQCLQPLPRDYFVFVQVLDATLGIRGQQDTAPLGGEHPTSEWEAGELIIDSYEVLIDQASPSGELLLIVGFYDGDTGERLPAWPGRDDNSVILESFEESHVGVSCEELRP